MKNALLIAIASLFAHAACGQQAVEAYANGADTYLWFSVEPYDTSKTYTIIQLSPAGQEPPAISHLAHVAKVVACEWRTSGDLNETLKVYHIKGSIMETDMLRLEGPGYMLNTTSAFAYLVLLDAKPQLLCCGTHCGKRLRTFFQLDPSK